MTPTRTSKLATRAINGLHSRFSENTITYALSIIVGLIAGVGAFVFRHLINVMTWFSFTVIPDAAGAWGHYVWFVLPAVGGLLVAPVIYFFAREAKGHGVPEVMAAVATKGGHMRPRVAFAKAIGSAFTIGTGGSAGSEGPIVQIGAGLGSTLGQIFRMSDKRVINLLACGAGGGISAIFNAPIAGVFFAIEVIIGDVSSQYVGPIVISSVVAAAFMQSMVGDHPSFLVPEYSMVSPWEMALYAGLGVVAALAAILFIKLLYASEDLFDNWKAHPLVKPAVGGIGVGIIGYYYHSALGTGATGIEDALRVNLPLSLLLVLFLAKMATTCFTLGSGGSGGIFAPALFMGAMLGGAFGVLANLWFPGVAASPGAYALVGMAAMFAGSAHAPITSILILFEMTGDYRIILPLMLSCTISVLIVQWLLKESIYSIKLTRKGIVYKGGYNVNILETIHVAEVMLRTVQFVSNKDTVDSVRTLMETSDHHGFPVLDKQGKLCGIICGSDVRQAISSGRGHELVSTIASSHVITANPDETLYEVLKRFGSRDLGHLPVVDPVDSSRVVGLITRADILEAYQRAQLLEASRQD
jgi:CIC family chloride channel protein